MLRPEAREYVPTARVSLPIAVENDLVRVRARVGLWALGTGHWALGIGHWASGIGHRALGIAHWALGIGQMGFELDSELGGRVWALGIGHWG